MNQNQSNRLDELARQTGHRPNWFPDPIGGRVAVSCPCGWRESIRHRNALARTSKAHAAINRHLREVARNLRGNE